MNYQIIHKALVYLLCLSLTLPSIGFSATPNGYYDNVDTSSPLALRQSLHEIIDDHTRYPYTSSSTDTWDILESADQDPNNSQNVLDIYKNASYSKAGGGNNFYNREHSWPKSYGFPNDGSSNYPYTDAHQLFISDSSYNSSRGNKPYDNCSINCSERPTEFNNGKGGTSTQSNWTEGQFTDGKWETWSGRRGDVARAMFYMAVRYEGGLHSITGVQEPDLRLTDDRALIAASSTGSNESVAYMGLLSVILQWHKDDPVDADERRRNDVVFSYQGNRNPFIDNPDYVTCVFENDCSAIGGGSGDTTPPSAPTGLTGVGGDLSAQLSWNANTESDLAGYHVYRSDNGGASFAKVTGVYLAGPEFTDTNLTPATSYVYQVTAIDIYNNESAPSTTINIITNDAPVVTGGVWVNEIHYDNESTDVGEGIELAGSAGTSISGWQIVLYNGNGGTAYNTIDLNGVFADQQNGFGTLWFDIPSIQNGAPDGIALVDNSGAVVQFLSYEGSFTANDGVASGQTSIDIGVAESSSTPTGFSLQLSGSGVQYSDFSWQAPSINTAGNINNAQSFSGSTDTTPPAIPNGLTATATANEIDLSWQANTESDLAGYNIFLSSDGTNFTQVNTELETTVAYLVMGLNPATNYFLRVSAIDLSGNESTQSEALNVTTLDAPTPVEGELWINEIHYDNASTDVEEFFEIAGPAGFDLQGTQVALYNGSNGTLYNTINLTGVISDLQNGFGTQGFYVRGIQNGSPDGIALISNTGEVVQFLSYEGSFTAVDGPAAGMTSNDIEVSENSSTPAGQSLQLGGSGNKYSDFIWQFPLDATFSAVNNGQSFVSDSDTIAPAAPLNLNAVGGDEQVSLSWNANTESDLAGYRVYQSEDGTSFSLINAELVTSSDYVATGLVADTTYYFYVTAVDSANNESVASETAFGVTDGIEDTTAPSAPVDLVALGGELQVELNWSANLESDLDGYRVYRSDDGGASFRLVQTDLTLTNNFTDTSVAASTSYSYYITAVDLAGNESVASLVVSATTNDAVDSEAPLAPVGLTADNYRRDVSLNWDANSESDLAGYNVYRRDLRSGDLVKINNELLLTTSFDTRLPSWWRTYEYVVTAVDTSGNESTSSESVYVSVFSNGSGGFIGWLIGLFSWIFE
ncbi:MAG: endonuclease [Gammaproteobacteria bacterium]|nr:endonuclease [Gammaproteobacteria bacterium]